MIYFGQKLARLAMMMLDLGRIPRTSIFDYVGKSSMDE
jgi:uncharacterized protein YqgQ